MGTSRAVQHSTFGGPDVLELVEVAPVAPGTGEVRVRVIAAGLNPVDYKMRRGGGQDATTLPRRVGRELAGVVESVGHDVGRVVVGDEVFGTIPRGALADYVTFEASYFARKPPTLPWPVAGSLALAGQTAWDSLASQPLNTGDQIIVSAVAGGVGSILAQLAVSRGVRVIGTASPRHHEWLRSRGIEPIDYGANVVARVRALTSDAEPVVAAFDHAGDEAIRQFVELGIPRDRINTIATDPNPFGIRRVGRGPTNTSTLDMLAALVVDGAVEVPIEATFNLEDVRAAYERLETRHLRGKIVVLTGNVW